MDEINEPTTVCADCREAEHYLCDGGAWDHNEDKPAICICWTDGHREQA